MSDDVEKNEDNEEKIFNKTDDDAFMDFGCGYHRLYLRMLCKSYSAGGCCKIFLKKFFPISSIWLIEILRYVVFWGIKPSKITK